MSDTEKNLQAALAKFSELSKKGFGKARESFVHSSHQVKGRIDLNSLEREKKKLLLELGIDVFAAIDSGKLKTKLFDDLIGNIGDVSAKMEAKERELRQAEETTPEASSEKTDMKKAEKEKSSKEKSGETEKKEE